MNPAPAKPMGSGLVLGLSSSSFRLATPGGLVDPDVANTADVRLWTDSELIAELRLARSTPTHAQSPYM